MVDRTQQALKQFYKARRKLAQAERRLNKLYGPRLKAACEAKDLQAIGQLIFDIPDEFKGKVRVYQAYIEIENEKKKGIDSDK